MTRTNVYANCVSVGFALLFFVNCNSPSIMPRPQNVVVAAPQQVLPSMEESPYPEETTEAEPIATPSSEQPLDESPLPTDAPLPSVASSDATDATYEEVVHRAELRGRVELHAGKRLRIEPLVITSSTYPVPGSIAELWIESKQDDGETEWLHYAEVKVAVSLRPGMPMELDIVKRGAVGMGTYTLDKVPPGSRVRVQWAW